MDLPLAVLLSDALIGGEPRQGAFQHRQAVAGGQADVEQLTCLLRRKQTTVGQEAGVFMLFVKSGLKFSGGNKCLSPAKFIDLLT